MFGLFNRKKKQEKAEEVKKENSEFVILVEKWDIFLAKIESRFNEALEHAEEALLEKFRRK